MRNILLFIIICCFVAVISQTYAVDPPSWCNPNLEPRLIGHRGDINNDSRVDITDMIVFSNWYHYSGDIDDLPCANSCDVNWDGDINWGDFVYLAQFLFYGLPDGSSIPDLPWPGVFGTGCNTVPLGTEISCWYCPPDCY